MALPRIFGILVVVVGCSRAPAKAPVSASPAPAVGSARLAPDTKSERVRSRTLDLPIEFMLQDKAAWRISEGRAWLEARQPETASSFALRTWRAERLVRRSECAEQARIVRMSIPVVREESILDQRAFAAPAGFDAELIVGAEPSPQGVSGFALVFGASVGYCYAAVFTTTASGSDAEQEIAARLRFAVDRVLSSVRTRSVDDRAVRRHLVLSPKPPPNAPPNESR